MSTPKAPSAAEEVRSGTGAIYHHMRQVLASVGRIPDDVAGILIVHFTYGRELCPIGFYELTLHDRTNKPVYWHFERQQSISEEEAIALVDISRLSPPERGLMERANALRAERQATYQYKSSKCVGGRHTECVTGPGTGSKESCSCPCHALDGSAREVLTRMCENVEFRRVMIDLVHQQTLREERQKQ